MAFADNKRRNAGRDRVPVVKKKLELATRLLASGLLPSLAWNFVARFSIVGHGACRVALVD